MPVQKRAVPSKATSIIVEGALVRIELRFGGRNRLVIYPQWPTIIPASAPAALAEASSLLSENFDLHRVEPIPINPRDWSLTNGKVLVFHLSANFTQARRELKTLALTFQLLDMEGSLDEM